MNTITVKILVFILSLFVLITVSNQLSMHFKETYSTETAMLYSSAEKITFKGIYVRNESVVTSSVNGVLSYPWPDGSKIAKDSVVAYIYKDENAIYINQQIKKLEDEIALLESAQNPGTTDVAQPEVISGLIEEKYQTITALIAKNDLETLNVERKNLQTLLGIYQIVINEEVDYNDRISSLEKKLNALKAKQKEPADTVTVDNSGYFISYVDGYEKTLTPEKLSSIDADLIRKIIDDDIDYKKPSKYNVGKLVDGYVWNMVGIVNTSQYDFHITNKVRLKFTSTPEIVEAEITDIIATDNPNESIIVLSCDKLNYNFVQRRVERIELVLNDCEGIKIPREALRFNQNNEKGVYILLGERVAFKKLDVIFECEDYLLSKILSDSDYISVYDDIIISGEIKPDEIVDDEIETDNIDVSLETNFTDVNTTSDASDTVSDETEELSETKNSGISVIDDDVFE